MAFVNPYNFVGFPAQAPPKTVVGGHDRHDENLYSGTIPITIRCCTPLLLPDHGTADTVTWTDGTVRPALGVRVDAKGAPLLEATAVKGMLRSAYEAITGSRMGVFVDHEDPLTVRLPTSSALELLPARVTSSEGEQRTLSVVTSLRHRESLAAPHPAIWVPIRLGAQLAGRNPMVDALDTTEVFAWIHLLQHVAVKQQPAYGVWRVSQMHTSRDGLDAAAPEPDVSHNITGSGLAPVLVRGYLHWHGGYFQGKHDERLVVAEVLDGPATVLTREVTIDDAVVQGWNAIITSYVSAHATEVGHQNALGDYIRRPGRWLDLDVGRTLHVQLDNPTGQAPTVVRTAPSMISRAAFVNSPETLLPEHHRPASSVEQMSDADAVFGWVGLEGGSDTGASGHRAQLRVDPPVVVSEGCVVTDHVVALATLNSPKPSNARFYLRDKQGKSLAISEGIGPSNGFTEEQVLAGWKVYEHDRDLATWDGDASRYWTPPMDRKLSTTRPNDNSAPMVAVPVAGRLLHREYLAPDKYSPNLTTVVSGWVNPPTAFTTTLHVMNLSPRQLGALLWLLNMEDGAKLRLGLGKPLGFGVVRVEADRSGARIVTGAQHKVRASLAGAVDHLSQEAQKGLADDFRRQTPPPSPRGQFHLLARGANSTAPSAAVHGPREGPVPVAEGYKWFTDNNKMEHGKSPGDGLPVVASNRRLPYKPGVVED